MRRAWVLLVAAGLIASACSDDDDTAATTGTPSPETTEVGTGDIVVPEWEPATRLDELALDIGTDPGGPEVQDAVDLFALYVPDFPGATPSDLPPGTGFSGTSALALLSSFRDELTDEQVAALDANLESGDIVATITPEGEILEPAASPATTSGWRKPEGGPVTPQDIQEFDALLAEVQQLWAAHLPNHPKHQSYELAFTSAATGVMDSNEPAGQPERCVIRVRSDFVAKGPSADEIRFDFAHELFHCMQFRWRASGVGPWNPHLWVVDGSAEFAAADLFRSRPMDYNNLFEDWFTSENKPLGSRQYDAWPVFENAHLNGEDVYGSIRSMFHSPMTGVAPMLAIGGLDGQVFRIDWSTRTLRWPDFGQPWRLDWPWNGHATHGPAYNNEFAGTRGVGGYSVQGIGKFAQPQILVTMTDDVGLVTVLPVGSPLTTRTANGTRTVGDGLTGRFCFRPDGCVCPAGQTADASLMDGPVMVFSFAAVQAAPRAEVVAEEWDPEKHCREKPHKDGSSDGDPHLVSFDGMAFDVSALGEFVLSSDPEGGFEVQTRHEPVSWAAGTTAVAIGTTGHRATFTMPSFVSTDPVTVRVDGADTVAQNFLVGDVRVAVEPDTVITGGDIVAAWPDGSTVRLHWALGWFVQVSVPEDRAARLQGLLGAADGDLRNDLALPNGTILDSSDVSAPDAVYPLAWAVDEASTLFDYDAGQDAETFRIPHPAPTTPAIDQDAFDRCAAALGGDVAAHVVSSCAFDVSATGDESFIDAYTTVLDDRAEPADVGPDVEFTLPAMPTEPAATAGEGVESVAGQPTLTLGLEQPVGTVEAVEGTVLVARTESCGELYADIVVTRSGQPDLMARSALCDPSGLPGVAIGPDDEWVNGEAYVWLPGTGSYDVAVEVVLGDADTLDAVDIYTDPTPVVLDAAALGDGERSALSGIGDTIVLLPDPAASFTAIGLDAASAVEVYWGATFPREEPFALGACTHDADISFPPTDTVIPLVVFNRAGDEVAVELQPIGCNALGSRWCAQRTTR